MNNSYSRVRPSASKFLVSRFLVSCFISPRLLSGSFIFGLLSAILCLLPTEVAAKSATAIEDVNGAVETTEAVSLSANDLAQAIEANVEIGVDTGAEIDIEALETETELPADVEAIEADADIEAIESIEAESIDTAEAVDTAAPTSPEQLAQTEPLPTDIAPSDWAFEAVSALIQRYDCLAGFPDGTFRGDQSLTRFEFAAALHACFSTLLERQEELEDVDLVLISRLQEDFATELAGLEEALDALGTRVTELEGSQFSRNFKLNGEIAFIVADDFGDGANPATEGDAVFQNRVRLQLSSSVLENLDDVFIARLTSGNIGNGFTDEIGTSEGSFVFAGQSNNDITIDRLHYYFSPTDKLRVAVLGNFAGHHFYADTLNPGLEVGGGADGALFQLTERNPIYRLGLGINGAGLGLNYQLSDTLKVQGCYLAPNAGVLGSESGGLFGGRYSALGQLVYEPSDEFELAFSYLRSFDTAAGVGGAGGNIRFGATGTNLADLPASITGGSSDATSNTFGLTNRWDITPGISLRSFVGYSDVSLDDLDGSADIFTYGTTLAFPNLFKPNALGAVTVGAEPYVTSVSTPGAVDFPTDVPLQVSAMYRYPISDRLSITPGFVWLTAPNQDASNDDAVVGVLRTTFKF